MTHIKWYLDLLSSSHELKKKEKVVNVRSTLTKLSGAMHVVCLFYSL